MYSKTVTIVNQTGLHARPASEFIGAASKFKCDLHIKNTSTGKSANAKSIIMLLALALTKDTQVEITGDGEDEQQAVDSLVCLIESGFSEG
ncbi:HPr family phosphocarrier protein [Ruminococcus gauvreauii]|uniref:Phosphocarrier protein HPr n=1 Tax=Ruminococcus gauvreauii TaxID=438033 RepID=A0ABY5VFV0_9FIRM|nr:HPr family phosphocarrier protein [Ruminococcus gauvreauii]UWP58806.1 HPr family phosphocarrier protein [Ruminococcus gauvreauii]